MSNISSRGGRMNGARFFLIKSDSQLYPIRLNIYGSRRAKCANDMITFFFIAAISIVKSETMSGCALVECPSINGHYATLHPNPLDSGSYCVCDWGGVIEIPCNARLHFDPVTSTCSLPPEKKNNNKIALNYCSSVLCSPDDCGLIVIHPNECNSFCKCINGTAQYLQCPDGLYFNPVLEVCDFKSHVQCNPIEIDLTGCEDVNCPTENSDVSLFFPNPKDCGSYCQCNWGTAMYMQCPPGLYFNSAQNICDYPKEAHCNLNTQPSTDGSNDVITTENSITMFTTSKHQFKNGCEYVLCPANNGEYALILANPYDCGSFCTCNWGEAIYIPCSPGLHFNSELLLCDWPENARCSKTSINPGYEADPNTDISKPPDTGYYNDIMITGCENVTCPAPTGVYKLPNPIDCSSYCKCDNGVIFHVKCRDDLHFNQNLEMCDKPQFAGCQLKSSTTNFATKSTQFISDESTIASTTITKLPTTITEATTSTTTYTEATTSTETTAATEITTSTQATSTDVSTDTEATSTEVSTDTEAKSTEVETTTSDVITFTTDSNVRPSPSSSTVSPTDGCSLVNCGKFIESEHAVHLSNPLDCGSFCKCAWGKAYYFSCPFGLHFNADLQICDWESNAGCIKSTLPAEPETTTIETTIETTPIDSQISTNHNLNGCEQVLCPVLNGEFALHFPNPVDCTSQQNTHNPPRGVGEHILYVSPRFP
ncbi:hypothetical protein B566_EDAN002670 [Ephemera danica]|nr:hypothetical protein B566_EDAN002670 [Ephemera danica]